MITIQGRPVQRRAHLEDLEALDAAEGAGERQGADNEW